MKPSGIFFLLLTAVGTIAYVSSGDKKEGSTPGSILFIGDSNTARPFSYADQLASIYPKLRIKKIAKVGAKTDWMLNELKSELATNKYDVVCVLGGSNDIYALSKIDTAEKNLSEMYDLIHSAGAKVVAVSPPNKNFYIRRTAQKQALLHSLIDWIKGNKNQDYYIDFWTITNNKKYFISGDGYLHAQAPAHKILADKVIELLKLPNSKTS